MDTARSPNNKASGQQQLSSPQSIILGSLPSSETGPVFGSYEKSKKPSLKEKLKSKEVPYQSTYADYRQPNQFKHEPVNLTTANGQPLQSPNQFTLDQSNSQQLQMNHQPRYDQAPGNSLQPTNVHTEQPMGVSPPIHSMTTGETTPTGQMIKTPQPVAPTKAPRSNSNKLQQGGPPPVDDIDAFGMNGPSRERSPSFASQSSSQSSLYQAQFHGSILHDPTFAPPPKFPDNLSVVKMKFFGDEKSAVVKSTLPSYELVRHSGECMARFSLKSMIIKKWRQCFWISYGDNQILFFRSRVDFEEWVSNPYLPKDKRDALVKLNVDFVNDLYKPSVNGYSTTNIRTKAYNRDGTLHHFKLERWLDYGPIIAAAFASKNQNDVYCLRRLMVEMIERSPQRKKKSGYDSSASSAYDSDTQGSVRSAFSRQSNKSATTRISVQSAPSPYTNNVHPVNNASFQGYSSQNAAFSSQAKRSKSVEPKKRGLGRSGRNSKQSTDDWIQYPGAFKMRTAEVDYAL